MDILGRKTLPHEIPSWVDPQKEIYFVTINCRERFRNQLAFPKLGLGFSTRFVIARKSNYGGRIYSCSCRTMLMRSCHFPRQGSQCSGF
jgi:hypothetical protein